jgi:hypothetical protein
VMYQCLVDVMGGGLVIFEANKGWGGETDKMELQDQVVLLTKLAIVHLCLQWQWMGNCEQVSSCSSSSSYTVVSSVELSVSWLLWRFGRNSRPETLVHAGCLAVWR